MSRALADPRPGAVRLKKRRQFLALNGGSRGHAEALVVQARRRDYDGAGDASTPRFGFTVTKKVGNAVVRNRIRRRLKAAVGLLAPESLSERNDYVVLAKRPALTLPFERLQADLTRAVAKAERKLPADDALAPTPRNRTPSRKPDDGKP